MKVKTTDLIKKMPLHIQHEIMHKLQTTHGEVKCFNPSCCGEYYRVDKWIEDCKDAANYGNTVTIMMCYECEDIIWIERNKENQVVELVNTTKNK